MLTRAAFIAPHNLSTTPVIPNNTNQAQISQIKADYPTNSKMYCNKIYLSSRCAPPPKRNHTL